MKNENFEMIMCIVNAGYSNEVMNAAKKEGAKGGTTIHARGTANKESEEFFHVTIEPEKEIVLLLVSTDIKDKVLKRIYEDVGLSTNGQGIAFSVPVSNTIGLRKKTVEPKEEVSKNGDK